MKIPAMKHQITDSGNRQTLQKIESKPDASDTKRLVIAMHNGFESE